MRFFTFLNSSSDVGWFSIILSFGISGDFPSSCLLGFRAIFCHSVFWEFGWFSVLPSFSISGDVPRFCLLGFGVIFHHSTVLSFWLLGSPTTEDFVYKQMRHYDVVNLFKNFSKSYYYRRKALSENIFCVSKQTIIKETWKANFVNSTLFAMR